MGWSMGLNITAELADGALKMAMARRNPPEGRVHHSASDGSEVPEARRGKGWKFQLASPKEASCIESVSMDGSAVLARLFGELAGVAKVDRVAALFVGIGGSVSGRIRRANGYLANSDEALSASTALMARAIGITPSTLKEVLSAEVSQEEPLDNEEDNWMEGFDND